MLTVVIIISLLCGVPLGSTNPDTQQVTSSPSPVDVQPIQEGQSESQ